MAAEGLITFEELRENLEALQKDHARPGASSTPASTNKEKIAALEADAESLLASYASVVPEDLRSLDALGRRRIYQLLDLRAVAQCDGNVEVSAPGENWSVCQPATASQLRRIADPAGQKPA